MSWGCSNTPGIGPTEMTETGETDVVGNPKLGMFPASAGQF